jgi:hypothetical protein
MIPLDYSNKPSTAPPRYANQLSPEEQSLLRTEFAPILQKYRRFIRVGSLLIVMTFIFAGLGTATGLSLCGLLPVPIFFAIAIAVRAPRLRCPNCGNKIDKPNGPFCPECARRSLSPGDLFIAPKCEACGKKMRNDRYGSYSTHACTHCGLWLDDEGI